MRIHVSGLHQLQLKCPFEREPPPGHIDERVFDLAPSRCLKCGAMTTVNKQ